MKVLFFSTKAFEIPYLNAANNDKHEFSFLEESLTSETAIKAVGYKAVSIFASDTASNIVIEKLKELGVEYIALRSAGYDNVNLFSAQNLSVKVANVPAYSPNAIAEHAVALLQALNRKLIRSHDRVKKFNFDLNHLVGFDLNNKTVGILGTGKIGSVMVKIMHGFGCKLLGVDTNPNKLLSVQYHLKYVSLEELFRSSDIISIHLPLTTETHHLVDKVLVDLMKPNAIIINTARGAILNTNHIVDALQEKRLGGLAIDVYEYEKGIFFKDHSLEIPKDNLLIKLNALPNVLITGHQAFLTEDALANIAETTIYNLNCWDNNSASKNELHYKVTQKTHKA